MMFELVVRDEGGTCRGKLEHFSRRLQCFCSENFRGMPSQLWLFTGGV